MHAYPPLTIALIAICVLISLSSGLGDSISVLQPLLIASAPGTGLREVAEGQVWRLITPIFLHFGILHIAFNMLWLWDLGGFLERNKGRLFLSSFVLADGIASNLTQYVLGGSPFFGGMSGVVYGMLGYMWAQGRFNPRFGFVLHKQIVVMMLIWFVLCWTGLLGPVANWAHTAGLVIGTAWGFAEAKLAVRRIRGRF